MVDFVKSSLINRTGNLIKGNLRTEVGLIKESLREVKETTADLRKN